MACSPLKQKDLARHIRVLLGEPGTGGGQKAEDVGARAEVVRQVCEKTLQVVMNIDFSHFEPPFEATSYELHRDAIPELAFIKYAMKLCHYCGQDDFEPLRDMIVQGDKSRTNAILMRLASLLKYREHESHKLTVQWGDKLDYFERSLVAVDTLRQEIDVMSDQLTGLQAEAEAERSATAQLKAQHATLEERVQAKILQKDQDEAKHNDIMEAFNQAQAKIKDDEFAEYALDQECQQLKEQLTEPPEQMRLRLAELRQRIEAERAAGDACSQRCHMLSARIEVIDKLEKLFGKHAELYGRIERDMAKCKEINKGNKHKMLEMSALEAKSREIETDMRSLKARIAAFVEKQGKIAAKKEQAVAAGEAAAKELREASVRLAAECQSMAYEGERLRVQAAETLKAAAELTRRHGEGIRRAAAMVEALRADVAKYRSGLLAAMKNGMALDKVAAQAAPRC
eukprot:m51a1_g10073 hypothetical protein (456) ;mRNA; r:26347-28743